MLYEINMYESRKEGFNEGLAQGKAEGIAEGEVRGKAEGKTELLNDLIIKFIISGKDTSEIMELLSVSEDMVSKVRDSIPAGSV